MKDKNSFDLIVDGINYHVSYDNGSVLPLNDPYLMITYRKEDDIFMASCKCKGGYVFTDELAEKIALSSIKNKKVNG